MYMYTAEVYYTPFNTPERCAGQSSLKYDNKRKYC